jgi:hypothetical protein
MNELREWLATLRPRAGVGNEQAELQALPLACGVQIVELQVTATGPVATIRAAPATIEQLSALHGDRLVIAPNSALSMS